MKNNGIRIAIALILQFLWLGTSHSADPGSLQFNEEILKQEKIFQSQGEKIPEGYVIDRALLSYTHTLSSEFDRSLAELGPKDRWLDIGAGQGLAILDYYGSRYDAMHLPGIEQRGKKAQAIAMSIEDRRTVHWHQIAASLEPKQIQYLFGRRLREYSSEELGKFQLITDVLGGFSYSRYLSIFMEKALGILELDGNFYTLLQDVQSENGTNRPYYEGSSFLTEISKADGSEVKVCSWLKSITCVEVTCEFKEKWQPRIEVFRIHKVCNDVTVPALVLIKYESGTPPERRFQLIN